MTDRVAGAPVIVSHTRDALTKKQLTDYKDRKVKLLQWLSNFGKEPEAAEGYSDAVVRQFTYQSGLFFRWLWEQKGGYTMEFTTDDVDEYMHEVAMRDNTNGAKDTTQKNMKRLIKYRRHHLGEDIEWEPEHSFHEPHSQPRDFLSIEERRAIREAALEYGSIPHYTAITPEERDRWKAHLAQRFDKPKSEVGPDDFERANGWKIPSLVWTTLDAGLRPVEVRRAQTYWVDIENKVLRIPRDDASKNADNWTVAISDRTASALERWLAEREQYDKYDGKDELWLSRAGTPYTSMSLGRKLDRLCEIAEIPTENRDLSWYSIRHSVGTYLVREEDLAAAQAQLRHKSPETTMKYDQTPPEARREALDKIG